MDGTNSISEKIMNIIDKLMDNTLYYFIGEFSSENLDQINNKIEEIIDDLPKKIKRKIFQVSIELTQNIYRHSVISPNNYGPKFGFYILNKISNFAYKIITGNFVNEQQKEFLKEYLSRIKAMAGDYNNLRNKYLEILNQNRPLSNSGGLGFIDIAKKTRGNFDFDFIPFNSDNLFIFYATINENKI